MIPQRCDDHIAAALALLTSKSAGQPTTTGLLSALVTPMNDIEGAAWDIIFYRLLKYAFGGHLDVIGRIVGEPRNGRLDADYLVALNLRIRVNRSQGTSEDVLQIATSISSTTTYLEYPMLAWEVCMFSFTGAGSAIQLLAEAKASTSYGVLVASDQPAANVFQFDNAGANINLFGSSTSGAVPALFPAAYPTVPPYVYP